MFLQEDDMILSNNPSNKELATGINSLFKSKWQRSYSYIKSKPKAMRSKEMPNSIRVPLFAQYATYMHGLAQSSISYDFSELHPVTKKELKHWDEEGGYCIHMSILLYGLLLKNNLVSKEDISYYQGYYDFPLRKDFPQFIPMPKRQIGIHAWLTIEGAVIDVTVNQHMKFFDFGLEGTNMILGNYPNDYKLLGYKESDEIIESYLNKFSEFVSMSVDEWLDFHHEESKKIYDMIRS